MIKEYLFGFPVVKQKIEEDLYDKDKIVDDILYNYNLNPDRNEWDTSSKDKRKKPILSNLHLSYGDTDNKFKKIDYSKLIPVYTEKVTNFINQIYFNTPVRFSYSIANYTCIKNNQYMREHIHPECDFTGIHYIKFNKNEHYSTSFTNTHKYPKFSQDLFPVLLKKLDGTKTENSWMSEYYNINTEEDDFIITPSVVEHSVPFHNNCENHRITIAINITIEDD